mgnify:CR=1 FL=1
MSQRTKQEHREIIIKGSSGLCHEKGLTIGTKLVVEPYCLVQKKSSCVLFRTTAFHLPHFNGEMKGAPGTKGWDKGTGPLSHFVALTNPDIIDQLPA